MTHLSDDQLSARLDAAAGTSEKDAAAADRHLAECAECRERLAALAELDASLKGALTHEPDEAYFASFAERVTARIAAESPAAAPEAPAAPKRPASLFGWWNSPRALAWVGGTAALAVVAALALVLSKGGGADRFAAEQAPPSEVGSAAGGAPEESPAPSAPAEPEARASAPEPVADAAPSATLEREAAPTARRATPAPAPAAGVPAARAREVRTEASGEQVQVSAPSALGRTAPPPAATRATGEAVRVKKPQAAQPLQVTPAQPQQQLEEPAAPAPTPVPTPAPAKGAAETKSRFDVSKLFEKAKAAAPAPVTSAPQSSTQGFNAPATPSEDRGGTPAPRAESQAQPLTALEGKRTDRSGGGGFRSSGHAIAVQRAEQFERAARRERTAAAWERAAGAWANAAAIAPDEAATLAARRSAAEALAGAWRLEPTEARRAAARTATREWLALAPAGAQQDAARALEAELTR